MRKWECGSVCPRAPILFPSPFPPSRRGGGVGASAATPSVCNMPQAENHPINWAEGRTLHAADDGGKTLHQIAGASRRWEE